MPKKNNIFKSFLELPPLVQLAIVMIIVLLCFMVYRWFTNEDRATQGAYSALSSGATISKAQAVDYANKLENAIGWFDDDEEVVYGVFRKLGNKADVYFIGEQMLKLHERTLEEWMNKINQSPWTTDDGTKNMVNNILKQKGIDYQF